MINQKQILKMITPEIQAIIKAEIKNKRGINENAVTDTAKAGFAKIKAAALKAADSLKVKFGGKAEAAAKQVIKIESSAAAGKNKKIKAYIEALRHMPQIMNDDWEDNLTEEKEMQIKIMCAAILLSVGGLEAINLLVNR